MAKYRPTPTERLARRKARQRIIQAANTHRLRLHRRYGHQDPLSLLTDRHLQRAVCIVRRNRLVKADVLTTAGFRAAS